MKTFRFTVKNHDFMDFLTLFDADTEFDLNHGDIFELRLKHVVASLDDVASCCAAEPGPMAKRVILSFVPRIRWSLEVNFPALPDYLLAEWARLSSVFAHQQPENLCTLDVPKLRAAAIATKMRLADPDIVEACRNAPEDERYSDRFPSIEKITRAAIRASFCLSIYKIELTGSALTGLRVPKSDVNLTVWLRGDGLDFNVFGDITIFVERMKELLGKKVHVDLGNWNETKEKRK